MYTPVNITISGGDYSGNFTGSIDSNVIPGPPGISGKSPLEEINIYVAERALERIAKAPSKLGTWYATVQRPYNALNPPQMRQEFSGTLEMAMTFAGSVSEAINSNQPIDIPAVELAAAILFGGVHLYI